MKAATDPHRREISFEVGNMVYLKLRPYRHSSLACRINEKLAPRFYELFQVIQRMGNIAYKLQLPTSSTIHPVFHVSQLRPTVGNVRLSLALLPQLSKDLQFLLEPEIMLDYRLTNNLALDTAEVLIK